MNDAAQVRFWQAASLLAPPLAAILPPLVVSLAGGFEHFVWIGQSPTAAQAFAIMGAMFYPFGAFFFAEMKADEAMARRSQAWLAVPGRIGRREVERRLTFAGALWSLAVAYSYEVAGQRHSSDRLAFAPRWLDDRDVVDRLALKYPVDATVTVHVDPSDPDNAVLETTEAPARLRTKRLLIFALGPFGFALLSLLLGAPLA